MFTFAIKLVEVVEVINSVHTSSVDISDFTCSTFVNLVRIRMVVFQMLATNSIVLVSMELHEDDLKREYPSQYGS